MAATGFSTSIAGVLRDVLQPLYTEDLVGGKEKEAETTQPGAEHGLGTAGDAAQTDEALAAPAAAPAPAAPSPTKETAVGGSRKERRVKREKSEPASRGKTKGDRKNRGGAKGNAAAAAGSSAATTSAGFVASGQAAGSTAPSGETVDEAEAEPVKQAPELVEALERIRAEKQARLDAVARVAQRVAEQTEDVLDADDVSTASHASRDFPLLKMQRVRDTSDYEFSQLLSKSFKPVKRIATVTSGSMEAAAAAECGARATTKIWQGKISGEDQAEAKRLLHQLESKTRFLRNPRILQEAGWGRAAAVQTHCPVAEALSITPETVEFREWVPGRQQRCTVLVTNRSKVSQRLRIVPPESAQFAVLRDAGKSSGSFLAPGMHCRIDVVFMPGTEAVISHQDSVTVQTANGNLHIPLRASRLEPELVLPNPMQCGEVVVHEERQLAFRCYNNGGSGEFSLTAPSAVIDGAGICVGPFRVSPHSFALKHDQEVVLHVCFSPDAPGHRAVTLYLNEASLGLVSPVTLLGDACQAQVLLEGTDASAQRVPAAESPNALLAFGSGPAGKTLCQTMRLWNPCGVALEFQWAIFPAPELDARPDLYDTGVTQQQLQQYLRESNAVALTGEAARAAGFQITPMVGTFPPAAAVEMSMLFQPRRPGLHRAVVQLVLKGVPRRPTSSDSVYSDTPAEERARLLQHCVPAMHCLVYGHGDVRENMRVVPAVLAPASEVSTRQPWQATTQLRNGSDSDAVFAADATAGLCVSPKEGVIAAYGCQQLRVSAASAGKPGTTLAGQVHISVPDYPRRLICDVAVTFAPNQTSLSQSLVDFHLVQAGQAKEQVITLTTTSARSLAWSLGPFDAPGLSVTPASGRVRHGEPVQIELRYAPNAPSTLRQTLCVLVRDATKDIPLMASVRGRCLRADVQLELGGGRNNASLDLGVVYAGQQVTRRLKLRNNTVFDTPFTWATEQRQDGGANDQDNDDDAGGVVWSLEPMSGVLDAHEVLDITLHLRVGQTVAARRFDWAAVCQVVGVQRINGFHACANVAGISVALLADTAPVPQLPPAAYHDNDGDAAVRVTSLPSRQADADAPSTLDFGNLELYASKTMTFLLRNQSGLAAGVSAQPVRYLGAQTVPTESAGGDGSGRTSIATASTSTRSTPSHRLRHTRRGQQRALEQRQARSSATASRLAETYETSHRFHATTMMSLEPTKAAVRGMAKREVRRELWRRDGVAWIVHVDPPTLAPFATARVSVTCVNDKRGVFDDTLVVRVDGLSDAFQLPLRVAVYGQAVKLLKRTIGLNLGVIPPRLTYPVTLAHATARVSRTLKFANESTAEMLVDWCVYDAAEGDWFIDLHLDINAADGYVSVSWTKHDMVPSAEPYQVEPRRMRVPAGGSAVAAVSLASTTPALWRAFLLGKVSTAGSTSDAEEASVPPPPLRIDLEALVREPALRIDQRSAQHIHVAINNAQLVQRGVQRALTLLNQSDTSANFTVRVTGDWFSLAPRCRASWSLARQDAATVTVLVRAKNRQEQARMSRSSGTDFDAHGVLHVRFDTGYEQDFPLIAHVHRPELTPSPSVLMFPPVYRGTPFQKQMQLANATVAAAEYSIVHRSSRPQPGVIDDASAWTLLPSRGCVPATQHGARPAMQELAVVFQPGKVGRYRSTFDLRVVDAPPDQPAATITLMGDGSMHEHDDQHAERFSWV